MADLRYNALRRNLEAVEAAGDKGKAALLRQRLEVREAELSVAPAVAPAVTPPKAAPVALPRERATTPKPRSMPVIPAPKKSEPKPRATRKRGGKKSTAEVVFTPAAKKED